MDNQGHGGGVVETIKVRDWMAPLHQCAILSEDATLYEALLALEAANEKLDVTGYGRPAVIVLEKGGRVIGKLSKLDILRCLEPKYAEMGDLKKIAGYGLSTELLKSMIDRYELWKGPLYEICRKASRTRIGEIANSPVAGEFIEAEASIDQAIHQLIISHDQSLIVTSKGKIVGILSVTDVFQQIGARMRSWST